MKTPSAVLASLFLAALPAGAGATTAFDPLAAYGDRMSFEVYRDDSRIGTHEVRFRRDGESVAVDVNFDVAVKMLGLTVYRFSYDSDSVWRDGRPERLVSRIDDDGTPSEVRAEMANGATVVSGPKGTVSRDGVIFPTNHWNPAVVSENVVVNTLTGELAEVRIAPAGTETVNTNLGPVRAVRYSYSGDLRDTSVWYDDKGRWVKLAFTDSRGGRVEYRCIECGRAGAQ
ncbi:MAG: DUF6134 family protein [Minwuia sp.]|uniref:DUF6134 family protein n=1 Tax=Minwuia sp. TaxID=2493630 RepID=UPI003A89D4B3